MTEVADLLGPNKKVVNDDGHNNLTPSTSNREKCKSPIPPDYTLLSERHYEAGPPEGTHMELVSKIICLKNLNYMYYSFIDCIQDVS